MYCCLSVCVMMMMMVMYYACYCPVCKHFMLDAMYSETGRLLVV
jgi:hypothetical protein